MKKILFLLLFPYSLWAQSKITVTAGRGTEVDPVATAVVGILKSNGTAISAATANTDYTTPTGTVTLTNKTLGSNTTVSESITWGDNIRQTFNPGTVAAGINVGAHTSDPSTPANGDVFYESTLNELRARINGAWVALGAGGGVSDGDKGNITVSGTGATWTIDNDVVTYAKMQDVSATGRFLGRITASAGDAEELTGTQATTLLDVFTTSLKGLVPAASGGSTTTQYLRKDGTWDVPPGTGGGGATIALDNLASVAINADLDPGSNNTRDAGDGTTSWKDIYAYSFKVRNGSGSGVHSIYTNYSGTPSNGLPPSTGFFVNRVSTGEASSATPTPTGDGLTNFYQLTALAANATFQTPSGSVIGEHNLLWIIIEDNGTTRTLSFNGSYVAGSDLPLPTATVAGESMELQFRCHGGTIWRLVGRTGGF